MLSAGDSTWELKKKTLRTLVVNNSLRLESLESLRHQPITHLDLDNGSASAIRKLDALRNTPLRLLSLSDCRSVEHFSPLGDLKEITKIVLSGATLPSLAPFAKLTTLKELHLSDNCERITTLAPLERLQLTYLRLHACGDLESLEPLRNMPLTDVVLMGCKQMPSLAPLEGKQLTLVGLSGSPVENLEVFKNMPIKEMKLHDFDRLWDLSALQDMRPTRLVFARCSKLQELSPLADMSLEHLGIPGCAVKSVAPLRWMPIQQLDISGCPVKDLSPLRRMATLQYLNMNGCAELQDLTPLKDLPQLRDVWLPPKFTPESAEILKKMRLDVINGGNPVQFWQERAKQQAKAK